MTSVAHNGFGCPYCRTAMAEVPDDEDEDDDSEVSEDDSIDRLEQEEFLMRGYRFFWDNVNGEEHDEDDDSEEQEYEQWEERLQMNEEEARVNVPSVNIVVDKLRQQNVSYEDLVKALLHTDHEEYDDEECLESSDNLFGKLRVIISNYEPGQEVVEAPRQVVEEPPKNITIRRLVLHI